MHCTLLDNVLSVHMHACRMWRVLPNNIVPDYIMGGPFCGFKYSLFHQAEWFYTPVAVAGCRLLLLEVILLHSHSSRSLKLSQASLLHCL